MSTKIFCDCCGAETTEDFSEKPYHGTAFIEGQKVAFKLEITDMPGKDGHICKPCLRRAMVEGAPLDGLFGSNTAKVPAPTERRSTSRARVRA